MNKNKLVYDLVRGSNGHYNYGTCHDSKIELINGVKGGVDPIRFRITNKAIDRLKKLGYGVALPETS